MAWKTKEQKHARWSVTFDPTLPVLVLKVIGIPSAEDAMGIGTSMRDFATEVGGPWAILSDLREMAVTTPEAREQWIANMKLATTQGLSRWAVVNSRHSVVIQSNHVTEESGMARITKVTFDMHEAQDWVAGVRVVALRQ